MMRPYPWKCGECKQKAVVPTTIAHTAQIKHENVLHQVFVADLPVHRCEKCGAIAMGEDADHAIRRQLRTDLGLLQPEEIRAKREALGLKQEDLANALGLAAESVCRWEGGVVQSRATNTALWTFFNVPEARKRLKINVPWEQAAARLLKVPAKSTPPRQVKPRKKAESKGKQD